MNTTTVTIRNDGPKAVRLHTLNEQCERAEPAILQAGEDYTVAMFGGQNIRIVEVPDEEGSDLVEGATTLTPGVETMVDKIAKRSRE